MKSVLLLIAAVLVAYSEAVPRCVTTPEFEGRVLEVDTKWDFERHAKLSYDANNQRIRLLEEIQVGSKKDYYDDLLLWKTLKHYRLNLKTRNCTVRPLEHAFRPFEIPEFAKHYGQFYIGSSAPNEGVLVDSWGGETPDKFGRYFGIWTNKGCLPVVDFFLSNFTGFVQTNFFDITIGILNPNIFTPPSECQT